MTRRPAALALALLLGLVALTGAPHAQEPRTEASRAQEPHAEEAKDAAKPAEPFELVRALQRVEDRIVTGDVTAVAAQGRAIEAATVGLVEAPPASWKDPRNLRALVVYLFSGGHPQTVRALLDRKVIVPPRANPEDFGNLIDAALAYAEGRDHDAKTLLGGLDPRRFTPSLGSHLALVQAMLAPAGEAAQAIRALDLARLLAPGTLVEEAALRRELFVASDAHSVDIFARLARQYIVRFDHSIYAQNFRQRFTTSAVAFVLSGSQHDIDAVFALLADLKPETRRKVYLMIAEAAVAHGRTALAARAARMASDLSAKNSPDANRAGLYLSATQIVGDTYEQGVAAVQAVDVAHLSKRDAALKQAVVTLARMIRRPPEAEAKPPRDHRDETADAFKASAGTPFASAATIDLAEKAITDADEALKGNVR